DAVRCPDQLLAAVAAELDEGLVGVGDHPVQVGAGDDQPPVRIGHFLVGPVHGAAGAVVAGMHGAAVRAGGRGHVREAAHARPQTMRPRTWAARLMSRNARPSLTSARVSTVSTASSPAAVMIT